MRPPDHVILAFPGCKVGRSHDFREKLFQGSLLLFGQHRTDWFSVHNARIPKFQILLFHASLPHGHVVGQIFPAWWGLLSPHSIGSSMQLSHAVHPKTCVPVGPERAIDPVSAVEEKKHPSAGTIGGTARRLCPRL